jgi:hypothetical protein
VVNHNRRFDAWKKRRAQLQTIGRRRKKSIFQRLKAWIKGAR